MSLLVTPEFYDIFGFVIFVFLILVAVWSIKKRQPLPRWVSILILLIGLIGAIVDGVLVARYFLN